MCPFSQQAVGVYSRSQQRGSTTSVLCWALDELRRLRAADHSRQELSRRARFRGGSPRPPLFFFATSTSPLSAQKTIHGKGKSIESITYRCEGAREGGCPRPREPMYRDSGAIQRVSHGGYRDFERARRHYGETISTMKHLTASENILRTRRLLQDPRISSRGGLHRFLLPHVRPNGTGVLPDHRFLHTHVAFYLHLLLPRLPHFERTPRPAASEESKRHERIRNHGPGFLTGHRTPTTRGYIARRPSDVHSITDGRSSATFPSLPGRGIDKRRVRRVSPNARPACTTM
jgi:hypothetical protein